MEFFCVPRRINFGAVIKEVQLFHYLKNLRENAAPDKSQLRKPPAAHTELFNSPSVLLRNQTKVFKERAGKSVMRKCIAAVKSNSGFAFKVIGLYQKGERDNLSSQANIGVIAMSLYSLAMEDFCEIVVSYRKLYGLRDYLETSIEQPLVDENDVKNSATLANKKMEQSFLDELTANMNVDLKLAHDKIYWEAFESTKTDTNSFMKSQPFSVGSVPSSASTLSKQADTLTIVLFGFTFSSSKSAGFTLLFGEVLFPAEVANEGAVRSRGRGLVRERVPGVLQGEEEGSAEEAEG